MTPSWTRPSLRLPTDFDRCERCLLDWEPRRWRYDQTETWMVLFDFYRSLDLPGAIRNLAVSFVHKFGLSAPQWYSLPQRVDHLGRQSRPKPALPSQNSQRTPLRRDPRRRRANCQNAGGWIAPVAGLRGSYRSCASKALQMPRPGPWTGAMSFASARKARQA